MSEEALAPPVSAEPKVGRRWCSDCGALPADHVKPVLKTVFGFQPVYELPCSVEGCNGAVKITREDLQGLHQAGLLADTFDDFKAMRDLQSIGMSIANNAEEDAQSRVQGGKLALAVARDRLRMAGFVPEGSRGAAAQVTVNAAGGQVHVEVGDVIDREMDKMWEKRKSSEVIDVTPEAKPEQPSAASSPVDDDGGWV